MPSKGETAVIRNNNYPVEFLFKYTYCFFKQNSNITKISNKNNMITKNTYFITDATKRTKQKHKVKCITTHLNP